MKKVLSIFTLLVIAISGFAQTVEMQFNGAPSAELGPLDSSYDMVESTQAWTMVPNVTLGSVTVSASYSNQQYTDITIDEESGLMFGASSRDFTPDDNVDNKYFSQVRRYNNLGYVGVPLNSYFSASEDEIGSGIVAQGRPREQNGAFIQYVTVEGIAKEEGVVTTDDSEFYMGDVTYTFSKPVKNPVIHISGFGGQSITGTSSDDAAYLWFSTEYELAGNSSKHTLKRLSGTEDPQTMQKYFDVDSSKKKIVNTFADGFDPFPDEPGATGFQAGSGSVLVETEDKVTQITFKVTMRAKSDGRWTQEDMYAGDLYAVSWSFEDPVCEASPASGTPQPTFVGVSTLDRNVNEWLKSEQNENTLGAYIAMESTNKAFVITRNAKPEENIENPVEGMVVWDTTLNCLRLYKVNDSGVGRWSCTSFGCNK